MDGPEHFRAKALELRANAKQFSDPILRADCERLAETYWALAEKLSGLQLLDEMVSADRKQEPQKSPAKK
jgi:hypothetical protein